MSFCQSMIDAAFIPNANISIANFQFHLVETSMLVDIIFMLQMIQQIIYLFLHHSEFFSKLNKVFRLEIEDVLPFFTMEFFLAAIIFIFTIFIIFINWSSSSLLKVFLSVSSMSSIRRIVDIAWAPRFEK